MNSYLSESWLDDPIDPAAEALASQGGELRIGRIVGGGPDGEVRFTAEVADGTVTYRPGVDHTAEVTLTDTYANAVAIVRGDLDPNAAFMRGQTKVTGATGSVLALLVATKLEAFAEARARLATHLEG